MNGTSDDEPTQRQTDDADLRTTHRPQPMHGTSDDELNTDRQPDDKNRDHTQTTTEHTPMLINSFHCKCYRFLLTTKSTESSHLC